MVRSILAAVVGYVTLFVVVFALFSLAFQVLGTEGAYQPGTYEVSGLWLIISLILSFVAAMAGGSVCQAIAADGTAIKILVGIALALGLMMAVMNMTAERADKSRPAEVAMMEAMEKSVQPPWFGFVVTIAHVAGIVHGGRLKGK